MPQFFVSSIDGDVFTIDGAEARHLKSSLRVKVGEKIRLFHCGNIYLGRIDEIAEKVIKGKIIERLEEKPKDFYIHLYQAIIERRRFELVISKSTELGVDEITPLITARTQPRNINLARWRKIIIEAVKQSCRTTIPKLNSPTTFYDAIKNDIPYKFVADEKANENLVEIILREKPRYLSIFIGPEGGFTEEELKVAKEYNVTTFSLGHNILRSETAAICSIAVSNLLLTMK